MLSLSALAPRQRADGLYQALHTRVPTANRRTSANTEAPRATCRRRSRRWRRARREQTAGAVTPGGAQRDCSAAQARLHVTCENPAPSPPARSLPGGRFPESARAWTPQLQLQPLHSLIKASLGFSTQTSLYGPTQQRAEGRTLVGDGLWRVGNSSTSEVPVELSELLILGLRSQKF